MVVTFMIQNMDRYVLLVFLLKSALGDENLCGGMPCEQLFSTASRITGGEVSERSSRPFQVALYTRISPDEELGFCGGALLDSQWVLTAAHCTYHHGEPVANIQVVLGAHSLYDRYESGRRIVNAAQTLRHPDYHPDTHENDVALLRLANVVQFTDTVAPVRLPYLNISEFNFAGQAATISGWGIATEGVPFISPTLRSRVVTVINDDLCNNQYLGALPPGLVCGFHATAGTCKGDNGGPMTIFYNPTEEDILIGVASFVGAGGCSARPSAFTRVTRHLTWISETTGILLD